MTPKKNLTAHEKNDHKVIGFHAVLSALKHRPTEIAQLYIQSGKNQNHRLDECIFLAKKHHISCSYLNTREFSALFPHADLVHQGILAIYHHTYDPASTMTFDTLCTQIKEQIAFLLVLDGVQDPHNLGACLRSANAAGVQAVIIPQNRAATLTPSARKAASGAAEVTPIIRMNNLSRGLEKLKAEGVWLYGLSSEATTSLYEADLTTPCALILGAEGKGLRHLTASHCDVLLHIPMFGTVESLNVSVATGICLFEAARQRKIKNLL